MGTPRVDSTRSAPRDAAPRRTPALLACLAGVAAVVLGVGVGELIAAVVSPASSPVAAIGGTLIDLAPPWAKDTAIALFGTADKIALLAGIALVMLALAALAGWVEARRPPWGRVIVAAFGVVGAVLAMLRPGAGAVSWIPSVVAGAVGAAALWGLVRMLRPEASVTEASVTDVSTHPVPASDPQERTAGSGHDIRRPDRRAFFAWSGAAVAAGVVAIAITNARRAGAAAVTAVRNALRLPAPAVAASAVPSGAELALPGLARVVTPNDSFYRIDTALIVPEIDPADWSLRITGMVERDVTITWDELLALPLEESYTTLACVSNEVGGSLIGNAKWLGYPIRDLLARAAPTSEADMVLSRSIDGFTASTPLEVLTYDRAAILAVGMNDEPLPLEHGFPVRMVVPGLYGYVSATKWVTELKVTRFDADQAYWSTRGWSERGPIKLQSRIDVPRRAQGLKAGDTVIAGVAWQQHVGVSGVEVQIDEGEWMPATLATAISDDTWVQWSLPWTATEGDHLIRCRATSATGEVQTDARAHPAPDGATGWHERFITVFA
ncbi:DMSO/TMAO reductase YedYZ molybdopterin-dependent catalytic subunit [Microbacterium terrae]|uniref:Sulfoxide reductase catalytic subunit YedY n=1 Tax=Microbacterium terrae TaxID=69369 RepID=A0A0M2HFI4_9MICO|nr:molybdopterin-dependent oxidoreductase [Microbacterium terrae]KJL43002.1 Sulfoxide reductase catalytic subunit YedY precursor [Microbacterium terrae]MBP1079326.1 DMSO/TMAO reductase YedYZ molybdopterin-dependent catalytic subunit [Microbacterium terrae]GLJ98726.1 oxidoreductase [Microbacterium terrae]